MPVSLLLLAAVPLAWLLPNHYLPWLSAWQDGWVLALLFAAALCHQRPAGLSLAWAAAIALAAGSVVLQWAAGLILFGGDALLVLVYLAAFALSIALGTALPDARNMHGWTALDVLALGVVVSAVASVGIAMAQWTGSVSLGVYGADLPRGTRPFANLAQPNHFSTLCFLGLCSLALLCESRRVGKLAFWTGALFLLVGMVMSVSRTGWLQAGTMILMVVLLQGRTAPQVRALHVLGLGVIYALGSLAWPWANELLLLSGGRGATEQIEGGARGPLWWALLDAAWREPWLGYGWQQVVMAQQAVALDHAPILRHFEHSHNIVLDLLLWAGIPVGATIVAVLAAALFNQTRAARDARVLWLLVAVAGVLVHGLLELPLEYAYFLIPAGFALGAAHAICPAGRQLRWPVVPLRGAGAVGVLLLAAIAAEYLQAEQNHRLLRLESARIGVERIESEAPHLRLLTQLSAFLAFARTEARPGMQAAELEQMRRVAQRFAFPSVMLRYALAAGLNGQPLAAQQTLARLCRMHPAPRCVEAREGWQVLQSKFPVLLQTPAPELPGR